MKDKVWTWGSNGWAIYEWDPQEPFRDLVPTDGKPDGVLAPGFVDIHIHGAFGIDFMDADSEKMLEFADRLESEGYEAFLPTTVTASAQQVERALSSLPTDPRMPGFHLEGPFISPQHPGAQPPEHIVAPGAEVWEPILADDRMRVITLAPEIEGASRLIASLARRGVRVSIGHTDATYRQCEAAAEVGAEGFTHTYNAMRGLHHREAGTVGFALMDDRMDCELIYDRVHVSREAAALLIRCKGPAGVIGISDSSRATGLSAGTRLEMWGHDCVVDETSVRLASNGALAGSAVTLATVFRNLWEDFGPEVAVRACCINPRRAIRMEGPVRRLMWFSLQSELRGMYANQP